MNRSDVDGAIDGADAVIVALNSTRRSDTPWAKPVSPPRLMADSVANATAAMTARGIRRIVVVSAFGVGDSLSRQPLLIRWMITRTNLSYTYATTTSSTQRSATQTRTGRSCDRSPSTRNRAPGRSP